MLNSSCGLQVFIVERLSPEELMGSTTVSAGNPTDPADWLPLAS
jgi:hypothetical protein